MSRSIDLFIDAPLAVDELAATLQRVTGFCFSERPEGGWELEEGDVRARLSEHHYVDDGNLLLSRYRYVLSARAPSDARLADHPAVLVLRDLMQTLHRDSPMPVLMVLDLQRRLTVTSAGPGQTAS